MELSDLMNMPGARSAIESSVFAYLPKCAVCKKKPEWAQIHASQVCAGDFVIDIRCHGKAWSQGFNVSGIDSKDVLRIMRESLPEEFFAGPWKGYEVCRSTTKPERRFL